MSILTDVTKSEWRHISTAIRTLSQHCIFLFVQQNFVLLENQRCFMSVIIQNNLQVSQQILVSFIQFLTIPLKTALSKCLGHQLWTDGGQRMQQCEVVPQRVLGERISFIVTVHQISLQKMTAKALGSKIFEDRNSLKQLMSSNNPLFNQRMKRIINKNYDNIQQVGIFQKRNQPTPNLFFFNASLYQSSHRQQLEQYMLKEVQHFHSNFQGTFALVYIHSSFVDFLAFRRIVEKWPQHFFYRLRRVYILTPSVMVKIIEAFSVGSFYRLCDQLFLNVDSEQELRNNDMELLRDLGQSAVPTKSPSYKNSIMIIQNSIYGKLLDQYDLSSGRYPVILLELLARMLRDPNELKLEGIFRKSCDSEQLQRLENQIINKDQRAIWNEKDILVVCGCLKKIMNNLCLPLFNYSIYQQVINYQAGEELQFIKSILASMQYVNHKVFILIVVFLNDYIIAQKDDNKMSAYNLAVVLGPCFFRPKEYDLKDLIYSGKFARILVSTFDKHNELIDANQITLARGTLQGLRANPLKW